MFIAERGKGAFLNDQRIRVAGRKRLADAVIACGLPHLGRGDLALARKETGAMQEQVAGLRRFGAAALDLAWVAAGRLDGYWERDIKPWDMAAGSDPGARGRRLRHRLRRRRRHVRQGPIVAGNEAIQKELLRVLKEAGKGLTPHRNLNSIRRFMLAVPAQLLFPCHASVPYCGGNPRRR